MFTCSFNIASFFMYSNDLDDDLHEDDCDDDEGTINNAFSTTVSDGIL